ncbi:glutaminase GtaA [Ceratobasidium sp. AG-Ba]|nr:glutaminase GtaA [Ceratobasidium sp. AG-Ba]
MLGSASILGLFVAIHIVFAQNLTWQTTPFNPPQFPLVVKSPYTAGWAVGANTEVARQWPHFGTTGSILGWTCYAKVDNLTYHVIGVPSTSANSFTNQTQTQFTATRTIVTSRAGPVDLTVTFLSPLDYTDLVRLSLPFSYISISAASNDGRTHTVTVYMDVSGEWVTGDNSQTAQWSTVTDNNVVLHKMFLQNPSPTWSLVNVLNGGPSILPAIRRLLFLSMGMLGNSQDTQFRGVSTDWPILAISQNLGGVSNQAATVTFVLGHTRNPAVSYITANGQQDRSLYFLPKFATEEDAVRYVVGDYQNALASATQFDNKVQSDGAKISADYASVLALSTRQAFASMEITLAGTGSAANLQDVKIFTKDLALDGGSSMSGVFSTVDSLYAIMPMLVYTNPSLGNYALASLLEYAPFFKEQFAPHDLGLRYPQVISHAGQSRAPVDSSASMIIMTAAFMRYTGDAGLAAKHYYTLKKWADFLVQNALIPSNQLTPDWYESAPAINQTNIALKGLIALRSMVEIQNAVGMSNESSTYSDAADNGLQQWIQLSSSGTKFTYAGSPQPFLLHALYADKLLGLNFVPDNIYAQQRTQYSSGMKQFGVSLTGGDTLTSTAWQYFTLAALAAGQSNFAATNTLTPVKNFAAAAQDGAKIWAPADVYDITTGAAVEGYGGRGHVGGAYALLALNVQAQPVIPVAASPAPPSPTASVPTSTSQPNSGFQFEVAGNTFLPSVVLALVGVWAL